MIDDRGLAWIEEPIVYDNLAGYAQLAADLKTPIQIGENFFDNLFRVETAAAPNNVRKPTRSGVCSKPS